MKESTNFRRDRTRHSTKFHVVCITGGLFVCALVLVCITGGLFVCALVLVCITGGLFVCALVLGQCCEMASSLPISVPYTSSLSLKGSSCIYIAIANT